MTFGTEKQICTRRLISEGSNGRCVSRHEASKIQSPGPNCVDGDVYTLERVIKFCKLQKKVSNGWMLGAKETFSLLELGRECGHGGVLQENARDGVQGAVQFSFPYRTSK